ncbi:DUF3168 domain-containing protein [Accumulibacter sp.]|uniref:tail completion protein gp17 n=1 Tax=Accumulibacter sp. TaxID=2053492 RepID=UPI0025F2E77F|nr:DUF3168 domain-containing protein [Accumulibacter sp.]MCM8596651.1 hypothetical protein [Accumulibacter sp.]MCM8625967.1 hypothetical protein [Accumulibacter sp.]MDS4050799.1 hypothetical protein [Accumulibacter sp.]
MSSPVEPTLVALAAPLLAGGLHPNVAPPQVATPYGVYQVVVSLTHNTLSDGVPIAHDLIQIGVWEGTYAGALAAGSALAAALQAAFDLGTLTGVQRSRQGRYDPETALHGFLYEYSFWSA